MSDAPVLTDDDVGLTFRARRKSDRFYSQDTARQRVRSLDGNLYHRVAEYSEHDEPEFHLHDPSMDWTIIFVVGDEKPIIITQCHRHWDYGDDPTFTFVGGVL